MHKDNSSVKVILAQFKWTMETRHLAHHVRLGPLSHQELHHLSTTFLA
jgi:hypothetical protein